MLELDRKEQRRIERDPDRGLEHHRETPEHAERGDPLLFPELGHLLLHLLGVVFVLLADCFLFGSHRLHLNTETLNTDL